MKNNFKKYLNLFENLHLSNIDNFRELLDNNIIFIDPFNNVKGIDNFIKIFKKNFRILENPKFKIINVASNDKVYFVKWEMYFFAFGKGQKIIGLSEIRVDSNGLILFHFKEK